MIETPRLTPVTAGFVLAAAFTIIFNTALAWAKDLYPPLSGFMASIAGHQWTTHGLADLTLFVGLGLLFTSARLAENTNTNRLTGALIGSVVVAALGLALWFAFV